MKEEIFIYHDKIKENKNNLNYSVLPNLNDRFYILLLIYYYIWQEKLKSTY